MPADPLARSAPAGDVADSAQRWQRVKQMVGDALELPVEDRERFVKAACDLDPALLKEVEEMLRACTEAEGFLEQPPPLPTPVSATDIELAIRPGQWVGPFQIQELLGRGGMGVVFRAQDPKLQREVALKFLTAALAADEKAHQRLYREARILSSCRHPGIPLLYDICDYSGYTFLVMELLEGHALSEQPEQPLACAALVRLALQVCEVLSCAHAQGIIHRDIKPANIFLDRSGHVKVLDFGIAKLASRDPGNRHIQLTESRAALGTISYLSPEQARGEEVDPRSDLFSLGAVLFELATGQRAFSGATHAVIFNEILSKTVPAPSSLRPELPRQLDRIISKLLEKDPRQRYQSAAEVQAELGILLNSLENTNPSVIFRPDYRALVWLVSASFVAALSVGLLWRANHSRTDHRRHEPAALVSDTPPSVAAGRRSVAVLGFKDLKASSETAWLSTALSEMLSTELAVGPSLRVISGEEIAHLKSDLVLREGESYSAPTLRRIQKRVGSDLVVVGSYLDAGPPHGGEVRLDLQVQDAHRGETVATVSETGRDTQLLSLISQTGSDLRTRLGLADAPPGALDGLKAYISPDPEAARLYAEGLDRLRLFEYRDAQQLLKRAVERDPASPVAHAALAEAWSHLGSDEKAREQARAAFDASKGMLREGRLWMEGQYRMAAHQYDRAAQIYQALFAIAPDNLDYGLRLSAARVASGRPSEALAATKALRQLPVPLRDDPRIDLAEADAINITGPIGVELKLAEQAAAKARQSGSRVLVEQASLKRANCLKRLGRYREALSAMGEARRIANVLGDVPGQAFAARQLGNALFNHGDLAEAQETLAEARALYRRAGDQTGEAFALNYFAMVQGREGDLGGALSSLRDSLALARRGGSTFLVAAGLKSLAQIAQLQGQLADAEKTYAQAQSLSRASGFQLLLEEILIGMGEIQCSKGNLREAEHLEEQALESSQRTQNSWITGKALLALARTLAWEGKLAEAEEKAKQALALYQSRENELMLVESNLILAELMLLDGRIPEEAAIEKWEALAAQKKDLLDEYFASTVLLKVAIAKDEREKLERQIQKVEVETRRSEVLDLKLDAQITVAQALARRHLWPEASSKLQTNIGLAERHSFDTQKLMAKAVFAKLLWEHGEPASGQQLLRAVTTEAQQHGIELITKLAPSPRLPTQ